MNGNTVLTILGVSGAVLNQLQIYFANGTPWPLDSAQWTQMAMGILLAAITYLTKAASVGSQPGDPPTPSRVAGAQVAGSPLPKAEVAASATAVMDVVAEAQRDTRRAYPPDKGV